MDHRVGPVDDDLLRQWPVASVGLDGVCDYTRPPFGDQPSIGWATYADGPGGQPMGDPPESTPLS